MDAELLRRELFYDPRTGEFRRLIARGGQRVGSSPGYVAKNGYRYISIGDCPYLAHRLAWLYVHGTWPTGHIDHINRKQTDNRIANLRDGPRSQNMRNSKRRRDNTTGTTGVYWFPPTRKWMAGIFVNGKQMHLGYFVRKVDAVQARIAAEAKYYHAAGTVPGKTAVPV